MAARAADTRSRVLTMNNVLPIRPTVPAAESAGEIRADALRLAHLISAHPRLLYSMLRPGEVLPWDEREQGEMIRAAIDEEAAAWVRLGRAGSPC